MAQFIYDVFNSPATWVVIVIWALICILDAKRRDPFLGRIQDLITKPIVFKQDQNPESNRFYPRANLEDIATAILKALKYPLNGIVDGFKKWIKSQIELVWRKDRPFRILGFLMYLGLFVLFVWADAIAIVNTLATLRLLSGDVPEFLTRFELAVAMGSLGSVIAAGLIAMDIYGDESKLSMWEDVKGTWKSIGKSSIRIILFLAFLIVFCFGLQRLQVMQPVYTSSPIVSFIVDAALVILVPLNTILTTMLIAFEALLGIFLLIIALQGILFGVLLFVNYIVTILAYLIPWGIDTLWRLIVMIVDFVFYVIATPFQWIGSLLSPFRSRGDDEKEKERKEEKDRKS